MFRDAYEFLDEKFGSEKTEKSFFFLQNQHKRSQCFSHRYIYDDNKNNYMFIKKS